jgi:membrane-bound lytic murein transglycosylase B
MARLMRVAFAALLGLFAVVPAGAATLPTLAYHDWLQNMEAEAIDASISSETVQGALDNVVPDERIVALDQKQPEGTISFATYAEHIVSPARVQEGRKLRAEHKALLKEISEHYGVQPEVIMALWGIESVYGRNSGDFSTIDALVTLAYEGRRAEFFRKELLDALRILDEEHMPASALRGSWAGAVGQCQFMPTTYLHYAVDYDESGKRDVWNNPADVFASIANYISADGWDSDYSWGREVKIKGQIAPDNIGIDRQFTLKQWQKMGVRRVNGAALPDRTLKASLIQPDGPHGRSFLVYDNFRALLRWNRSTYFALAVGLLADKIK